MQAADDDKVQSASTATEFLLAVRDTYEYWRSIAFFARGGPYEMSPYFASNMKAKVHTYARALPLILWSKKHYRSGTFQHDLIKNLRNVAFPGTGLPLSTMCCTRLSAWALILLAAPAYSMAAAFVQAQSKRWNLAHVLNIYRKILLEPKDWFSFWRCACFVYVCTCAYIITHRLECMRIYGDMVTNKKECTCMHA
jgi:hypothetical protein